MRQINFPHGTHTATDEGVSGIGFNSAGVPVIIDKNGIETPISVSTTTIFNIIANKGVGAEIDIPSTGLSSGDVYVSNDSFKMFTYNGSGWIFSDLVSGQIVTDVSNVTDLPPVYQFCNDILMAIANKITDIVLPE